MVLNEHRYYISQPHATPGSYFHTRHTLDLQTALVVQCLSYHNMEVSVEDLEALRHACEIVTTSDAATEEITHVTQQLQQYQATHPDQYALAMIYLLKNDDSVGIRALAAVFLRTHLTQMDRETYVVEEAVQSHLQSELFECIRNEEAPYVTRNITDTIASVGAIAHGFKQWDDLIPQTLELARSEVERHRLAAVDLLGRLYTTIGHQLEPFAADVFEFFSSAIADENMSIASMAVVSACRAVVALEDLEARLHYQSLVPKFLDTLVRALQQELEQDAKVILSAMIDLVYHHSDSHYFKKYPKLISQVMNDIAMSEQLSPAIRQFALSFLVNLIELGSDVFGKHKKFVETTLGIIFSFMSMVTLDVDYNTSAVVSYEEESENTMYNMGIESFARISAPLGKRVVRQVIVPVLGQMLTSYTGAYKAWATTNPRAAADRTGQVIPDIDCSGAFVAVAAFTQIVDDRHHLQIFKLGTLAQCLVNPCHPRLRACILALYGMVFMHYPVKVRTEIHAKVIPAALDIIASTTEFMRVRHTAVDCVGNFLYECPEQLSSVYARTTIETIIPLLEDAGVASPTKELVFTTLGRLSDACPSVFSDYQSMVIPALQRYVMQPETEEDLELRPSALGALTHIGHALGDAFVEHARELLDFFVHHNSAFLQGFTIGDICKDKQRSELSLLQSLARLCNIVPEEFARCLSVVFPIIINNIIQMPTGDEQIAPIRIEPDFTVESLRAAVQESTAQFYRASSAIRFESTVDDENPIEKMRNSEEQMYELLEDKILAISLFTDMPLTLGRRFAPYAEAAAVVLGHIIATVHHDEIVQNSLVGYPRLVKCVGEELQYAASTGENVSEAVAMLECVTSECIGNILTALHRVETSESTSHCMYVLHAIFQFLSEISLGISMEEGDTLASGTGLDANGEPVALGFQPRFPQFKGSVVSHSLLECVVTELRKFTQLYLQNLAKHRDTLQKVAEREKTLEQIAASSGIQLRDLQIDGDEDDAEDGECKAIDADNDDDHTLLDPKRRVDFRSPAELAKERDKIARIAMTTAEMESNMLALLQAAGESLNTVCIVGGSDAFGLLQDWIPELLSWLSMDVAAEQRAFPTQIMRGLIPHASAECIAAGFLPQLVQQCLECLKDVKHAHIADNAAYTIGLVAEYCTPVFESDPEFMRKTVETLCEQLEATKQYIAQRQEVYEAAASEDVELARAAAEHIVATRANKRSKRAAQEEDDEVKDDDDDDDDDDVDEEMDEIKSLYYIVDNITCTLGRFVYYCQETSLFNIWLGNLPVREDIGEGEKTYRILYALTQQNPDLIAYDNYAHLPALLTLWASVYTSSDHRRPLRLLAANMLVYFSTHAAEGVGASLQTLNDDLSELVAKAIDAAPKGVIDEVDEEDEEQV